jgi:hypothetical protein
VRRLLVLACAAVAVVAAPACGGDHAGKPRLPRALPRDFIGIVAEDAFAAPPRERRRILRRLGAAGVRLIRQTFDWSLVERAPGRYELGALDAFVAAAAAARIEVLPVLFNPPRFRSSAPRRGAGRTTYPPARPSSFGRFAARLARRYGPRGSLWRARPRLPRVPIRAWQVWNEPNLPIYWGGDPDPPAYARLLAAAKRALKAVDPHAEVVSAGLAESRLGMPFEQFVHELYEAGAADSLDTFALHPYAADAGAALRAVDRTRELLDEFDPDAPIWVTELGWASGGPRSPFTVGERGQAARIGAVLGQLVDQRRELGVRGVVYFNWRDAPPYPGGHDFFGLHTGLLRRNGSPKPAFHSFRAAVREAAANPDAAP